MSWPRYLKKYEKSIVINYILNKEFKLMEYLGKWILNAKFECISNILVAAIQ